MRRPTLPSFGIRAALARTGVFRALGPRSLSSALKISLDVAYWLLIALTALLLLMLVIVIFVPMADLNISVSDDSGGRQMALTRPMILTFFGALAAYFGAFAVILRSLRLIFRSLTLGDPFHPDNVRRLRRVGALLALVTAGVWVFQNIIAARLAPGIFESQGIGALLTPVFSVLVVFVLAEVFREGARLRRESELTI